MAITLRPASDSDIREFAAWQYDPPYDVYDIRMSPNEAVAYFLEPDIRCSTLLHGDEVAGFCTFGRDAQVPGGKYDADGIDIGLGIKPVRTGSGDGHRYVAAVVAHAAVMFASQQLRVTIATGNKRALRVWSGAGFVEISRFATSRRIMGTNEFAILALQSTEDGGILPNTGDRQRQKNIGLAHGTDGSVGRLAMPSRHAWGLSTFE